MQFNLAGVFTVALAGFAAISAAHPHRHSHHGHAVKPRDMYTEYVTKTVDQNGNPYVAPTQRDEVKSPKESGSSAQATTTSSTPDFKFASSTKSAAASATDIPDNLDMNTGDKKAVAGSGVDRDFPDGELPCSEFPTGYGAIPLSWVTKDGWSGIQKNGGNDDHIGVCTDGALCSYACPPGYSKAQWPEVQPQSGESMGGLKCKNGKLYRTRDGEKKLCQKGHGTASVQNKLDQVVAFCRTDYPGE
jgi:hypothetical protein